MILGMLMIGQRQEVIARFQMPVTEAGRKFNPVVMLISLKSGAVGLNLTAASNVFLVSLLLEVAGLRLMRIVRSVVAVCYRGAGVFLSLCGIETNQAGYRSRA
jgi:hypothetical protein